MLVFYTCKFLRRSNDPIPINAWFLWCNSYTKMSSHLASALYWFRAFYLKAVQFSSILSAPAVVLPSYSFNIFTAFRDLLHINVMITASFLSMFSVSQVNHKGNPEGWITYLIYWKAFFLKVCTDSLFVYKLLLQTNYDSNRVNAV